MVQQPNDSSPKERPQVFFVLAVRAVQATSADEACEIASATTPAFMLAEHPPEVLLVQSWSDYLRMLADGPRASLHQATQQLQQQIRSRLGPPDFDDA